MIGSMEALTEEGIILEKCVDDLEQIQKLWDKAVTSGIKTLNVTRQFEQNKIQKIRVPGETNSINSKMYVEKGSENSVVASDEQLQLLQAVAQKVGRDIVLTNQLSEDKNGKYENGKIYIRADLNENYMLAVALHEATHVLRANSPLEYQALCEFIMNYLVSKGENVNSLLDNIKDNWKDNVSTEDDVLEELVCQTVMAIATNEQAINTVLNIKENKNILQKVASALKKIAQYTYDFMKGIGFDRHNLQAQAWLDDAKAIQNLAEKLSSALDKNRNVTTAQSIKQQKNNTQKGETIKYSVDDTISKKRNDAKKATELSESNFREILDNVKFGLYEDKTYIPVRATTPEFFIEVVKEHSKGDVKVMQVPMASVVEHMRQNMDEDDGTSYGNKRPHNLEIDDVVGISKGMGHPTYIVRQKNGRYAMVVSFYNKKHRQILAVVDFASNNDPIRNYKYKQYMNGFNDGYYNIIVTQYEPDDLKHYLETNEVIYDKKKMNGRYQVGSGRIVTFTHDIPFINNTLTQPEESVKSKSSVDDTIYTDTEYMKAVENDDMETAQRLVDEATERAFAESKIRDKDCKLLKVYHGTPKDFTVFRNSGSGMYFTADPDYARGYTQLNGKVLKTFLNIKKPFDILNDSIARKIFIDEFIRGGYAQGIHPSSTLTEINKYIQNGVDWVEGDNLIEFLEENEYDYDGLIINEGSDSVATATGNVQKWRGYSYVTFNSEQIKSADPVTYDDNGNVIPLSERFNEDNNYIRYQYAGRKSKFTKKDFNKYDDLTKLDTKQIKVYNDYGWTYQLFTAEDYMLLNEKFNEKYNLNKNQNDFVLGDGSRVVEVNNKLVLIGGSFENPIVYDVLIINTDNETDAEIIKEEYTMQQPITDKIGEDILISAQFTKALLEIQKSETTSQQILAIIRDKKTQGKEQYYQSLSKITDILNNSKTEEEIIQKLNKEFPTTK